MSHVGHRENWLGIIPGPLELVYNWMCCVLGVCFKFHCTAGFYILWDAILIVYLQLGRDVAYWNPACLLFSSLARRNMAITSQTLVVQALIFLNVGPAGILDPPFVQPLNGGKHRLPSNSLLIAFRLSRGGIFLVTCQILRHHTVATAIDTP